MRSIVGSIYRRTRWSFFWDNYRLPEVELSAIIDNYSPLEPPIKEKLCLPPYAGPIDHDDVSAVLALVQQLKPRVVLELGTAHGATVANICAKSDARVFTVNALPEQIQGNVTTFALTRDEIGEVYRDRGFSDRVVQIYANTWKLDLLRYVPAAGVDIAIIDACHDIDFVINDFHCVLPVMREGSVVLFHDVHPSMVEHLRESYLACMYLRKLGYNIQHLKDTWWGLWRRDDGEPDVGLAVRGFNGVDSLVLRARGQDPIQDALTLRWLFEVYHRP